MTTHNSKKSASVSPVVLAQSPGVTDPLPAPFAQSPPAGFVPTLLARGGRPQKSQVSVAPKAAAELRSAAHFAAEFGSAAPDPLRVADSLTTARAWSEELQRVAAWHAYVKDQEHLAWKQAFAATGPLRVPFQFCAGRDPTVAERYPSVFAFFAAPSERTAKGVMTKKKKKRAAKAAAAG